MPTRLGVGFAHTGEGYLVKGPNRAFRSGIKPAPLALHLHGATGTAALTAQDPHETKLLNLLSRKYLVLSSDWGGDTFGNDTAVARIAEGIANARATYNVDDSPVVLVGMSMGTMSALSYTLQNPTNVRAVAGMIPGLDINDIIVNNRGGLAASVNAAYGGTYDNTTHGPTHSPVQFASSLPADLPIRFWTSTNDTYAVPASVTAFVNARPQTGNISLGAVGHSTASITGWQDEIAEWCLDRTA